MSKCLIAFLGYFPLALFPFLFLFDWFRMVHVFHFTLFQLNRQIQVFCYDNFAFSLDFRSFFLIYSSQPFVVVANVEIKQIHKVQINQIK